MRVLLVLGLLLWLAFFSGQLLLLQHSENFSGRGKIQLVRSAATQQPRALGGSGAGDDDACVLRAVERYTRYAADATAAARMRKERGPLRIAAFSRLWIPPIHRTGGMQLHAFHIYSQLASRGHYVHVFVTGPPANSSSKTMYCIDRKTHGAVRCRDPEAPLVVEQVPSTANKAYSVAWLNNSLALFNTLHAEKPFNVVHSESWAAVPNIHQLRLPFVVTWHGSMLDWFRNELNYVAHNYRLRRKAPGAGVWGRMQRLAKAVALEEYMLLTVPQHIVISDAAERDLVEVQHVAREQVALIYNGVNTHIFYPRKEREVRNAFLRAHRVPPENYVVGCGGRLVEIKGHLQLSHAMRLIMQQYKNVTLLVSGDGPMSGVYEAMRVEGLSVVQLGMLPQEQLGTFYQAIDVFVDPFYQHHGLNTVMLEAALSGVPLVVTALGGALSVVPCTAYGRLFTIGDVTGLAREILYYMLHPEEAQATGRRARERAMKLFDSDVMAMHYERVLYRLVETPPSSANITGKLVCTQVYPAFCYREPA
ncbi:putative glycosyl transferase-like [Trypanosoma conorhini]|uniref:Putative glycosyl transferase-like n=1 Tax=Trypanosoma conorhini TaxID=83891 RepID=A0A422Q1C7_9TRYP|nr:putative glycosyl transferase-like [Trypanosoma conorhini]RNF23792.1 putative glycosyl transferase-like [Trypanosoma conorhini]